MSIGYASTCRLGGVLFLRGRVPRRTGIQDRVEQETDSKEPKSSKLLDLRIETCSREFADLEHLPSNLIQVHNLWARTELGEDETVDKAQEARDITKGKISSSLVKNRDKKMAYFFRVLEGLLGLQA
jgi:hypothetical protein